MTRRFKVNLGLAQLLVTCLNFKRAPETMRKG
ncbi:hypothetical protein HDE80_002397 [Rhodanobacter sp. A1T4]|nr:hypothetical protein [Rhodanobacter sp. A1T4]